MHIDAGIRHSALNGFNYAHQENNLENHRNGGSKRIVFFLFVELRLFLRNSILVAVVIRGNEIQIRLHLHHFDGVFLHPDGDRHQDQLTQEREQNDRDSVVSTQAVALHNHPRKSII